MTAAGVVPRRPIAYHRGTMSTAPDPTGDALYAAILAHPDEDTPRLAYADHIEEFGDPHRAEFIRLQCQLAAMKPWDEGYTAADVRCRRRLAEHPEWTAAVGAVHPALVEQAGSLADNPRGPHGVFVRGFPGRVGADPFWFADHHARLFDTFPIRDVGLRLEDAESRERIVNCPGLARLSGLGVSMWNWDEVPAGLGALARLAHATALKRLEVYAEAVYADPLESLLNCPQFRTLESFALWSDARGGEEGGPPPAEAVRDLARSSWLFGLTDLRLDADLFAALCDRLGRDVGWTPRLTRLSVRGHLADDQTGLAAVARGLRSGWFAAVEDLDLTQCGFSREVCDGLAAAGARPARLRLPGRFRPRNGDRWRPRALSSGWLSELQSLVAKRADDDDTAALLASGLPGRLRVLDLSAGKMNAARLHELLDVPGGWPHLEALDLSGNPLTDGALAGLVRRFDRFPRLVSLSVGDHQPLPEFVTALAASPAAARLRELHLSGPLAAADALARSPHLAGLDLLHVGEGEDGAAHDRLRDRFGPRVTVDDSIPF